MSVCIVIPASLCKSQVQVSVYCARRILGEPSVQSCYTLSISSSYHVFVYGIYRKSRLVCVCDFNCLDIARSYKKQRI